MKTCLWILAVLLAFLGLGQVGFTAGENPTVVIPGSQGGWTDYFVQPTASDNHATIKAIGPGLVGGIIATNNSATINYIRLYNAGSGFNGCNSATNLVFQAAIPAAATAGSGTIEIPAGGMGGFTAGISICVTSGYATTDTTNATASALSVNVLYN